MPRITGWIILSTVLALASTAPLAHALKFKQLEKDGAVLLVVYDCGNFEDEKTCEKYQTMFSGPSGGFLGYHGDAQELDNILTSGEQSGKPMQQVVLYSGGGNLNEGVKFGRVLRRHHATVRIIKGEYCISACTVAFMGGQFRLMDDGGEYRVHSGSMFLSGIPDDVLASIHADPAAGFADLARYEQTTQRFLARQLQAHFQNGLLSSIGGKFVPEDDDLFLSWAKSDPPAESYTAPGSVQLKLDVARYKREGDACIQDIGMRLEREAMRNAIEDVRRLLPTLGRRAAPALTMVESMYMTSIKETSSLDRETMIQMGYLTPILNTSK
jgi:hypothetical protein